jgi:hypothetical protein
MRPVCAELELHRDSSHHTDNKVDAKDPCPEAGGIVIALVIGLERQSFQDHNQRP